MNPLLKNLLNQHGDDLVRRGRRLAEEVRDGARDERTREGINRAREGLHTAGEGITTAAEVFREGVKDALNEFQDKEPSQEDGEEQTPETTPSDGSSQVPEAVVVEDEAPESSPAEPVGEQAHSVTEAEESASAIDQDSGIIERMEFDCHAFRTESGRAFIESMGLRIRVVFPRLKPLRLALPGIEYTVPKLIEGALISELKDRLLRSAWEDLTALGLAPRSIAAAVAEANQQSVAEVETIALFDADHLARMHWQDLDELQAEATERARPNGPSQAVLADPLLTHSDESVTATVQIQLPSGAQLPLKLTRSDQSHSPALVFTALRQELRALGFDDDAVAALDPVRRTY